MPDWQELSMHQTQSAIPLAIVLISLLLSITGLLVTATACESHGEVRKPAGKVIHAAPTQPVDVKEAPVQ
jgi:hypothetical protein